MRLLIYNIRYATGVGPAFHLPVPGAGYLRSSASVLRQITEFIKEQNPDVQVIGVHPPSGHDIPGVRSRQALALTDFFLPDEYDQVLEVPDEESYGLCRRLHLEESLIAGPSCGLALAGALRAVPDEPGVLAVVVFPDNAWKYGSSQSTV